MVDSILVGPARKPRRTESNHHANRIRIGLMGAGENIDRRFRCVMKQQFRTPVEQVRFPGIYLGAFLIFTNSLERMTRLFLDFGY